MRWQGRRQSRNVEDRRGMRAGGSVFRGGGRGIGGLGLGGVLVVLALGYFLTGDPMGLLTQMPGGADESANSRPAPTGTPDDEAGQFAAFVLADTEDTWSALFQEAGSRYQPPTLVLFDDAVESACGFAESAVGPFYCPGDHKVYIDLSFFSELARRFGAPGDFAQAYVIAHEVGHHIQNLTGVFERGAALRQQGADPNQVSIQQELQADCLAGVWGHYAQQRPDLLEPGDLEEGLNAAAAIGDDRIQRQTQGRVTPETWTHGSAEQRVAAFRRGLESGRMNDCREDGSR
jgi:hypothetical protein